MQETSLGIQKTQHFLGVPIIQKVGWSDCELQHWSLTFKKKTNIKINLLNLISFKNWSTRTFADVFHCPTHLNFFIAQKLANVSRNKNYSTSYSWQSSTVHRRWTFQLYFHTFTKSKGDTGCKLCNCNMSCKQPASTIHLN